MADAVTNLLPAWPALYRVPPALVEMSLNTAKIQFLSFILFTPSSMQHITLLALRAPFPAMRQPFSPITERRASTTALPRGGSIQVLASSHFSAPPPPAKNATAF